MLKQVQFLKDVEFIYGDYQDLLLPDNSLIYCDPPYENTTKYKTNFDHNKFWNWCRNKSKEGHLLYISEYNAPEDFTSILNINTITNFSIENRNLPRQEKLFIINK